MHSRISLNNRLIDATRARIAATTSATLYGRGVFTTLAIHGGHPFLWPAHWVRLISHAEHIGVDHEDFSESTVRGSLDRLVRANGVDEGRARLTLLSNSGGGVWDAGTGDTQKTNLLIMTGDPHHAPNEDLSLTVSPHRINPLSPLAGIKSVNYLEHVIAWEEARSRDFDEAVRLNERGEIVSATMANIFWVTNGTIHTPALVTGALAGTTRARVIELASELSMPIVEGVYDIAQLAEANEIFVTSATYSVRLVTVFDFHRYTVAVGSLALRLHEAYRQLTIDHTATSADS